MITVNKKENRVSKIALVFFLVIIISINTFAAVVSDNDGAAFITKAEFDSLKNEFQAELNTYNNSLDNKIDAAIDGYIKGIRVGKTSKLRSTLEVAGQTYNNTSRKSYVFAGNSSPNLFCRYNYDNQQFIQVTLWDCIPKLFFRYANCIAGYSRRPGTISANGLEMYGADQFQFLVDYDYRPYDSDGNELATSQNAPVFVVDDDNYVTSFKLNAALHGFVNKVCSSQINDTNIMAIPFIADDTHKWKFTFKDVVGANGTNGMGYSTRKLGHDSACVFSIYRYQLFANGATSRSGDQYLNKTISDRAGVTRYIMNRGSSTEPYLVDQASYNWVVLSEWVDGHWHFDESRFGSSYAWCMPFGHLEADRKVPCFRQWPAWEAVNWVDIGTHNIGDIASTTDRIFTDTSLQHHWYQGLNSAQIFYENPLSRTYFNAFNIDIRNYIEIDGMLPIWKENPLKDWRLLKNKNIKNALNIDVYYAAAPPLTSKFSSAGTFTWVAKINQEDVERIPGRNWGNWGTNRIYFTSAPMDDIEYDGTNVKVSNTKKFQFKKHGTTAAYTDCQSQVINGRTYYYQTLDHDTYYDFKMDVDSQETVYYMIFDESHPSDYCLEVIEHPDYQIEFTSTE